MSDFNNPYRTMNDALLVEKGHEHLTKLRNLLVKHATTWPVELLADAWDALGSARVIHDEIAKRRAQAKESSNTGYDERNRCVAALCSMAQRLNWSTWLGKHEPDHDHAWDPEWLNVVYINLPTGQVSWHIHDRDLPLFAHVPRIDKGGVWDGHTTDRKYKRLAAITYGVKCCVSCGADLSNGPTAVNREAFDHLLCVGCRR